MGSGGVSGGGVVVMEVAVVVVVVDVVVVDVTDKRQWFVVVVEWVRVEADCIRSMSRSSSSAVDTKPAAFSVWSAVDFDADIVDGG